MRSRAGRRGGGSPRVSGAGEALLVHRERLYRAAFFLCGGEEQEARELFQETMAAACGSWKKFRGESGAYTYLYRIMLNTRCRLLRHKSRTAGHVPLDTVALPAAPGENPLRAMVDRERRARVRRAVLSLAPIYQSVVVLHYMEELSCREIGRLLALPEGTVRSRLVKARRLLARLLAGESEPF